MIEPENQPTSMRVVGDYSTPEGQPPLDRINHSPASRVRRLPVVFVTAGNFSQLRNRITDANNNPASHYIITLTKDHTYNTTTPSVLNSASFGGSAYPYITGTVTIIGENATLTRSSSATEHFRLLTVMTGGFLRIENLTITGGRVSKVGGGGILNHQGTLEVYRSTIQDNRMLSTTQDNQVLGGGIYSYYGDLSIVESRILENRALQTNSDGGGIGIIASIAMQNMVIIGSEISGNYTKRNGNGLYIQDTDVTVQHNCFMGNYNPSASAQFTLTPYPQPTPTRVRNASAFIHSSSNGVVISQNWWGHLNGPRLNLPATANRDSLAGSYPDYQPFATAQPTPCNRLPTATVTPSTITLADYGITIYQDTGYNWDNEELNNIFNGVTRVGDALSRFQTNGVTPQDKFKTVMGTSLGFLRLAYPKPSGTPYEIYHNEFDNKSITTGYCQVFGSSAVIPTIVVACRGQITSSTVWNTNGLVTEYSVVHELGHVLDLRSGLALRNYVGSNDLLLVDCAGSDRLMGVTSGTNWNRGQRGWGTAFENSSPPPLQRLSQFQQNPEDSPVEAAADMFLNWVYRRTSDTAPTNIPSSFNPLIHDNPAPTDACNYSNTGTWVGFANIIETGEVDDLNDRPGNVRYWWIEGTLDRIFRDLLWKK